MREALAQARDGPAVHPRQDAGDDRRRRATSSPGSRRASTAIKINPEKIGAVIGPGGKMIRSIQEETGTKIDIDDDGTVSVAVDRIRPGPRRAIQRILGLTQELRIERGEIYTGKVVSIMPYGAFVEILPGQGRPGPHLGALGGSGDPGQPGRGRPQRRRRDHRDGDRRGAERKGQPLPPGRAHRRAAGAEAGAADRAATATEDRDATSIAVPVAREATPGAAGLVDRPIAGRQTAAGPRSRRGTTPSRGRIGDRSDESGAHVPDSLFVLLRRAFGGLGCLPLRSGSRSLPSRNPR